MKKICLILFFILLFGAFGSANADENAVPDRKYRALLIGCDEFLSAENTVPNAHTNVRLMTQILSDTEYEINLQDGILNSANSLEYAIKSAFSDADEGDISLLYISTHGAFDALINNPEGKILLSDGSMEEWITVGQLKRMLDCINGDIVLIVDACHSGALIGKGVSPDDALVRVSSTFHEDKYHVLTSAGASELAWFWQNAQNGEQIGSSFFTEILSVGMGLYGEYEADINEDEIITLAELYDYLLARQAASTAQLFPEEDDLAILNYHRGESAATSKIRGIEFGEKNLNAEEPVITFRFEKENDVLVGCRVTSYTRENGWEWENAVTVDTSKIIRNKDGDLNSYELALSEFLPPDWTYVMAQIVVYDGEKSGNSAVMASSLFHRDYTQDIPSIRINAASVWNRSIKKELDIFVEHENPLTLSIEVYDESGHCIKQLNHYPYTRPQELQPNGNLYYWNGTDEEGRPIEAGEYTIKACVSIMEIRYISEKTITVK